MKLKTILITAVIVLAGSLTFVSAQETTLIDFSQEKRHLALIGENVNNLVVLHYIDVHSAKNRKIVVKIYNDLGKRYYSKSFSRRGTLNMALNTSQLPIGNYTVEIYNKRELVCSKAISKQIKNKNKTSLSLFAQENSAEALPFLSLIGDNINNKVSIEYIDLLDEKEREMIVRIFNESGKLLYTRSFLKEGKLDINYDITRFPEGEYFFELYNSGELVCSKVVSKQTEKTMNYEAIANNEK